VIVLANIKHRIVKAIKFRFFYKPYKTFIAPLVRNYIALTDKNFESKIIVKVDGGLGSQMWQYALGRGAGIACGLPVLYDLTWFDQNGMDINNIHTRAYQLESVFPKISIEKADLCLLKKYRMYFDLFPGTRFDYDKTIFSLRQPRYLGGYYVNAKYIDDQGNDLRDEFTFRVSLSKENQDTLSRIEAENYAVALHVRRGDYVGSIHDVTSPRYFKEAVKSISDKLSGKNPVFFVFSNGMDWSREIFDGMEEEFIFVENNNNDRGEVDMFLMSRCQHFIISNSSFSWWPAWLSRRSSDKIVVAPDVWLANEHPKGICSMVAKGWATLPAS
jgi:hypothetical protein